MTHEHNWMAYGDIQLDHADIELCLICGTQRHKPRGASDSEWVEGSPPLRNLRKFTDDELLAELRYRGRLGRVPAETFVPHHHVNLGYPIELQIAKTWKKAAETASDNYEPPAGMKAYDDQDTLLLTPGRTVKFELIYLTDAK